MITAPLLNVIQQAGEGVLVLIDDLDDDAFKRSRLTRSEVKRQLGLLAGVLQGLPPAAQQAMPEIDWGGWRATALSLAGPAGDAQDDTAWFAARSLVPATLSWLRVYRQSTPALFDFTA